MPNPQYVSLGSRLAVSAMVEPYVRTLRTHVQGRLLDCGCGDVPYYGIYRQSASSVTCIDWSACSHGRQHVDLEVDLNGALPFEAESFDTVLLADVLEHIAEPAQLLSEIARTLSTGGKLLLFAPFLYNIHEEPHDYYRYTKYALHRLCLKAGLEPLEIEPYGGYPDVLLDTVNKGLKSVPPLCHLFLFTVGWLTRTSLYERWRRATSERFPLGYCVVARKG